MNYWLISDTHLGHTAMTERFYRPEGFEEGIYSALEVIEPGDVLIHLGDVAFRPGLHEEFHRHVNKDVKRWLVRGNHDQASYKWYLEHGWDFVAENIRLNIYGEWILLTHIPVHPATTGINIHGHTHGRAVNTDPEDNACLISIEDSFKPVTLRTVAEDYRRKHDSK